jgi:hypothetical protein
MLFRDKKVVTKKDHRCFGCGGTIPAGSTVSYFSGVSDDGDFSYGHVCPICQIVLEDFDWSDGGYCEWELINEDWCGAARKFEERTGKSYNSAIIPLPWVSVQLGATKQ